MEILFADDHVMLREALRPFLLRLDQAAEVHEAGCMSEVLDHLEHGEPSLVVLDLRMPGMNGVQGIKQVKERRPAAKCAILSAICEKRVALETIAAGADGFIPKQLSGGAMVSALQLIMAGETFLPSLILQGDDDTAVAPAMADLRLTQRERDILDLLKDGLSNKGIANRLGVSDVTVKSHLGNAFRKLGVHSRMQAIRLMLDTSH